MTEPATETELMLKGYGLTTAEIFYHMPDYTHVL
ncbi:MAG: aspartate-semialdehyde dehydrogenase, partial [Marinibacterium sp.]